MPQAQSKTTSRSSGTKGESGMTDESAPGMEDMREDLEELFFTTLKDIYYAEKQIMKTLPKMAKAASSAELIEAFEAHHEQTAGQVERLEEVFKIMGKRAQGATCEAIEGIIAEGKEVMDEFKGTPALNIGLVGAAKAVEHYEMARYESLVALAAHLGMAEAETLLQANLEEEKETNELLDKCCEELMAHAA